MFFVIVLQFLWKLFIELLIYFILIYFFFVPRILQGLKNSAAH